MHSEVFFFEYPCIIHWQNNNIFLFTLYIPEVINM